MDAICKVTKLSQCLNILYLVLFLQFSYLAYIIFPKLSFSLTCCPSPSTPRRTSSRRTRTPLLCYSLTTMTTPLPSCRPVAWSRRRARRSRGSRTARPACTRCGESLMGKTIKYQSNYQIYPGKWISQD